MTTRQHLLRLVYPIFGAWKKLTGSGSSMVENKMTLEPRESFYDLSIQLNNGSHFKFDTLKGKNVLLVNTASDCGYTPQYAELKKLSSLYPGSLAILAFPSNEFKGQEQGTDEDIEKFCRINYDIDFPIAVKGSVLKGKDQQSVFQWLCNKNKNGWNDREPPWNFSKYLVSESGILTHIFGPAMSPLDTRIKLAIKN